MPRIALILPDVVREGGVRALLKRYFATVEAESFDHPADIAGEGAAGGHFDGYVTDCETFTAHLDFFLPRRTQCLVLAGGGGRRSTAAHLGGSLGGGTSEAMPRVVGTAEPLEHLLEAMEHTLLPDRKRTEESGSDELSGREVQVLQLVVSGAINKEIADRLNISLNTVLTHRKNITAKLGIKTISGLTLYALMHGYISADASAL